MRYCSILQNKKRMIATLLIVVMAWTSLSGCGGSAEDAVQREPFTGTVTYENLAKYLKDNAEQDTVTCWYTSDTDREWIEKEAQNFEKEYGFKVDLVYYDGVNLFQDMNQENQNGNGPDVYLAGNDQLELARDSGMAEENIWFDDTFWQEQYPDVAKKAVTYRDKQYGYPIYFDTYCLVYDANLLSNAPASIDDILTFLDEYEDTGSTKAIFRWDVADPYINTMFVAAYADLFGENGDDSSSFCINDDKSVAAMEYFQSLSQYLWMNKNNISHDTVRNRIKDETLVLGLCKSDILPTLYEMQKENATETQEEVKPDAESPDSDENAEETDDEKENVADAGSEETGDDETSETGQDGTQTNYQISYVPSLTAELASKTLSTTYVAFVNPYGRDTVLGNLFGMYLSYNGAERQYNGNGKLPVRGDSSNMDEMQSIIYAQYINSKPVPKVMILGDYLTQSGITFDAIWKGEDAKEQLDRLQTIMEDILPTNK